VATAVELGRGYTCVGELVTTFIATGEPPPTRVTTCDGDVADPYVPIAPAEADENDDAVETMATIERQLIASVGYTYWDGADAFTEERSKAIAYDLGESVA
jgi:hypothetical protein